MDNQFKWREVMSTGVHVYLNQEDEFGRWEPRAWVGHRKTGYHVLLHGMFSDHHLVGQRPYIERKTYLTLDEAKRAVERKVPGMMAVVQLRERLGETNGT